MTDIYSAAKQVPASPVFTVPSASINVYIKRGGLEPWYVTEQEGTIIVVTRAELQELILGYQAILNKVEENPNQLRLFDPDNPPEAPGDNRLDSAQ